MRDNFYVDDLLKSVKDERTAIDLIQNVTKMCKDGGFHLTKFVSNNQAVLKTIPQSEQRVFTKMKEISNKEMGERALGIHWDIEEDTLGFSVNIREKPNTRRGYLSMLSSIYDPLGLISPFILQGRRIIQELCQGKFDWDERVSDDLAELWEK
mgnify:CR=1 FL=1